MEAWLAKQAAARRAGRLSAKRAARLRAAGVALPAAELASSPAATWPTRLAQLERFQRLHGHCDVPQHYAKVGGTRCLAFSVLHAEGQLQIPAA